jgi:hypothetical protein
VSNGLSFTFLENKETQDVFRYIAPTLKLPGRKAISDHVLSKSANQLTESIVAQATSVSFLALGSSKNPKIAKDSFKILKSLRSLRIL